MLKKLTAAPIVKQLREVMPAPAYTDFTKIYVDRALNKKEENVAIRHEQAHIWLEHNSRARKERDHSIWLVACELEIARNIYNDEDISVISRQRSRLAGGYLPDSFEKMPADLLLAEDIYEWLLKNPQEMPKNATMCGCSCKGDEEKEIENVKSLVDNVKETLDKEESQKQTQEKLSNTMHAIKHKQPTLADELDALLRHRVVRDRSYRRPSRRAQDCNIIEKGRYSAQRRPLVEIFVDRSGSFDANKTNIAEQTLKKLLSKYNVQIRYDVFFFGNDKLSQNDFGGGGNTPYHLIVNHIEQTHPKIALVITDDDEALPATLKSKTNILCLPVGAQKTQFAAAVGGKDLVF